MVPCEQSTTRRTGGRFAKLSAKRNRTRRNSETTLKRGTSWVGRWCAVACKFKFTAIVATKWVRSRVLRCASLSAQKLFGSVCSYALGTNVGKAGYSKSCTRPPATAPVVGFSKFSTGRRHYKVGHFLPCIVSVSTKVALCASFRATVYALPFNWQPFVDFCTLLRNCCWVTIDKRVSVAQRM